MMDGVIVVYKEKGKTSFDAVAALRRILGQKKIGHMGTLDPLAEGVLPVCLGRATKLADLLGDGTKTYRAVLLLGVETDTQDITGQVTARREVTASAEEIRRAVLSFEGSYRQLTPMYSARKVEGKKLVDLARRGITVERREKEISIDRIELLSVEPPRVTFRVRCSKGTYIRTLCHDIGQLLGCGGIMESLLREEAAGFTLEDALSVSHIDALALTDHLLPHLFSPEKLVEGLPHFQVTPEADRYLLNGNALTEKNGAFLDRRPAEGELTAALSSSGAFLGLYNWQGDREELRPRRMLFPEPEDSSRPARTPAPSVISIGKFDGFHIGHRAILLVMQEQAREEKLKTLLFSFSLSPQAVLAGRKSENLLTEAEKHSMARSLLLDRLAEYPFTDEIRTLSAEDFLEKILIGRLGMRQAVIGPDCAFGYERRGNVDFLLKKSKELGFRVTVVDKVRCRGEIVSSTRIRRHIEEGDLEQARECLGYPYFLLARVEHGAGLGRQLEFPTINQALPADKLMPPDGVYAARVEIGEKTYPAMADLGTKPTVCGSGQRALETHILDFSGDLYGKMVKTELLHFLRPEQRFSSLEELNAQLKKDRQQTILYFKEQGIL